MKDMIENFKEGFRALFTIEAMYFIALFTCVWSKSLSPDFRIASAFLFLLGHFVFKLIAKVERMEKAQDLRDEQFLTVCEELNRVKDILGE